tara:strand:+ start:623 stop:1558 length:936 start_codon:yes stop_codon:yes gene_type:complete
MRYKDFKISLIEQSANTVDIIVYFNDNTTKKIDDIPIAVFNSSDFLDVLKRKLLKKFNKVAVRYAKVGDTTNIGNPDGNTLDTTTPTTLTTKKDAELEIEQNPDEVEDPDDEVEDPDDEVEVTGTSMMYTDDAAKLQNAWADRVDKDRDNKNDETGEPVRRMNAQGKYVDAEGNILDDPSNDIQVPIIDPSKFGGGGEGEEGEGGEEGIEGTSEIVSDLFDAMRGLGTGETKLINALRQIKSSVHLNQVIRMYRETHNSSMPNDIINEFFYDLGKNTPNVIKEVNEIMVPLGWKLIGMRFSTLRWEKVGNE